MLKMTTGLLGITHGIIIVLGLSLHVMSSLK